MFVSTRKSRRLIYKTSPSDQTLNHIPIDISTSSTPSIFKQVQHLQWFWIFLVPFIELKDTPFLFIISKVSNIKLQHMDCWSSNSIICNLKMKSTTSNFKYIQHVNLHKRRYYNVGYLSSFQNMTNTCAFHTMIFLRSLDCEISCFLKLIQIRGDNSKDAFPWMYLDHVSVYFHNSIEPTLNAIYLLNLTSTVKWNMPSLRHLTCTLENAFAFYYYSIFMQNNVDNLATVHSMDIHSEGVRFYYMGVTWTHLHS
ncbi:MAG: hypothetical protein Sylvanvirus11_1, partial [Sylvanvirus sp.]